MSVYQERGMMIGAALGFQFVLAVLTFGFNSPWILAMLWPAQGLQGFTVGMGEGWRLLSQAFSFFVNIFIFGLLGFAIGSIMPREEAHS